MISRRRSGTGASITGDQLSSVLWHASQLRERRFDGRFGQWESRTAPSSGGIQSIHLLVLPCDASQFAGIYENEGHVLGGCGCDPSEALNLNANSVTTLTRATAGTTIQLFADPTRLAACYENYETLMWRDAGAMIATLCWIAEALELKAIPLGRHGTDIVRSFGLKAPVVGTGAVHIGAAQEDS